MPRLLLVLLVKVIVLGGPSPATGEVSGPVHRPASGQEAPAEEEDRLRVFLLTMDQGDEVWERFGHNAILILDEVSGESLAWNWGLFDFDDVDFLPRFLRGTMRYSMGPAELEPFLQSYVRADRSVYSNEIRLTPAQARELDTFVRWNYLPENREYTYDYYRDNCSTRIRDVLDEVLEGRIHDEFGGRVTPHSYRWQSRRLVQETFWIDHGLSFLLGTRGDPPITEWETMFVPMELMELLEGMEVSDGEGGARPLLGPREVVYAASRGPTPQEAPSFSLAWLVAGLAIGGLAVGLGAIARGGSAAARLGLGVLGGVWGLFAGMLGSLLLLAWFTDHVFIHWNVNLLYASPLFLVQGLLAVPVSARTGWERGRLGFLLRATALLVAVLSLLAALLQATGLVVQGNPEVVAFALPVNIGLAAAFLAAPFGGERVE